MEKNEHRETRMNKDFRKKKWSSILILLENWAGEKTRNLKGNVS